MKPVRIIGLGSPFGDDRIGWLAVEEIRQAPWMAHLAEGITLLALDRPGMGLAAALAGADTVFLVDAVRSGAPPGSLHRLAGCGWAKGESAVSSHDLGVAAAVRMADALGELPRRLVFFGIETEKFPEPEPVSRAVRQSLPGLVEALRDELFRLQPPAGDRVGRP